MEQTGPYTKKVIETFQNPHNYGKIKNPDGVGKVGNVVCLPPGQNIHIDNNLNEINHISNGEKVLSHNGQYNIVSRLVARNYAGEILNIKNKLGSVRLTSDHLILAVKILGGNKFLRTKYVSAWYHAGQLKKGDMILYPILKTRKDLEHIEINIAKSKWDFRSKEIPNKIPLNSELLRLFGYFLSEGNIQDKPSRTFVTFSLNIKEKDIVDDIKKISKNLFGIGITERERPEVKTAVVSIYNVKLARFLKQLFGNGAADKSIPDFIMNLPVEKQKSLIYGLWKGDGYINLDRDGARAGYSTISYKLVQQMKILLLRQKIVPSVYTEKEKLVGGVRHRKSYRIHVGQRESLAKLCSILNTKYVPRSYISEKAWFDDSHLYIPITEIKKEDYKGEVYNLEVKNSHSFTSEAFCLHNCGDVMQLYIKVGKNKKGEEIIKDIKFETFGCVAAISTSSMITDLAKGKTIKQAMEITKDSVIESLGGLPKIKYHCSVLAVDALSEAIYDYFSKNKKPIPEELQKRHERIEKEKQIIEKKYEKWMK